MHHEPAGDLMLTNPKHIYAVAINTDRTSTRQAQNKMTGYEKTLYVCIQILTYLKSHIYVAI